MEKKMQKGSIKDESIIPKYKLISSTVHNFGWWQFNFYAWHKKQMSLFKYEIIVEVFTQHNRVVSLRFCLKAFTDSLHT